MSKYAMTCAWCGSPYTARQLRYTLVERPACPGCSGERRAWMARQRYAEHGRKTPPRMTTLNCGDCGASCPVRVADVGKWHMCFDCVRARATIAVKSRAMARRQLVHIGPPTWTDLPTRHPARRPERKRADWWSHLVQGPCAWCGEQFTAKAVTGARQPEFCSKKCMSAAQKARRGRFDIPPPRRRAIYDRDEWTCQLCGDPVEDGLSFADLWAATLDHIIPRSRGGSDDDNNLQLAHRWCNSVKGDESHHAADVLRAA